MANKTVVITGSTKGIGKGYAREFLMRGVNVVVSSRSQEDVDQTVLNLEDECRDGARVIGQSCNVADINQVQALWNRAKQEFGAVDIWINNAGFARSGVTLLQLTPDEIKTMINGNVIGTINGSQVAVKGMTEQGHGHLYNTYGAGSDGRVIPGMIGYGTTKSAVRYFTDSLIKELKGKPLRVGSISPGMNITENMINQMNALPLEARKKMSRPINILGDHVETTTPWIVDRILGDHEHGSAIKWMATGKILGRLCAASFRKRNLFSRYDVEV